MNDHKKNVSFEQFSKQIQLALNNFKHTHLQDSLLEEIKEMVSQILVYRLYHNEKIISKNFKKDLDMLGVEWEEIDLNYNNKEDLRTLSKILGYPANEMNSVDVQIEIDDFIQNNKNLEVIISNFPL